MLSLIRTLKSRLKLIAVVMPFMIVVLVVINVIVGDKHQQRLIESQCHNLSQDISEYAATIEFYPNGPEAGAWLERLHEAVGDVNTDCEGVLSAEYLAELPDVVNQATERVELGGGP